MEKIRFATIGTSQITHQFVQAALQCPDFVLAAAYSRDKKKAGEFGRQYGADTFYDSLDSLAADTEIDAVYIASPNSLHCEQSIQMLQAKKHVLCEKAIGSNSFEVKRMIETAQDNGVILLEAVRSLYDPSFAVIKENLGKLGKIRQVSFQFGKISSRYHDFKHGKSCNIFEPALSAGGLMDIGIYCVEPMAALFGRPEAVTAFSVNLDSGIDGAGIILARYDGMVAELSYSKISNLKASSQIAGERGTMLMPTINSPRKLEIIYPDGQCEHLQIESCGNNMIYEAEFFIRAIQNKADVRDYQQISLLSMEVMDQARKCMDVVFPADETTVEKVKQKQHLWQK